MRTITTTKSPDFGHLLYMAQIVEARDPYTAGHLWRVAQLSKLLGKHMGLSQTELYHLTLGAYLHDLGKISVPDQVLNKKGRLEPGELTQMRSHALMGYQMLVKHELGNEVAALARDHHEHWDGNGYPNKLAAKDISVGARILGLCDTFDAMTSTRPYRKGMSIEKSKEIIREVDNIQFEPMLVKAFMQLDEADLSHIVGHSDLNRPLLECPVCGPVVELPEEGEDTTFCRVCTGKFDVKQEKTGKVWIDFAGDYGTPEDLTAKPNMAHLNSIFSEFSARQPQQKRSWRDLFTRKAAAH